MLITPQMVQGLKVLIISRNIHSQNPGQGFVFPISPHFFHYIDGPNPRGAKDWPIQSNTDFFKPFGEQLRYFFKCTGHFRDLTNTTWLRFNELNPTQMEFGHLSEFG